MNRKEQVLNLFQFLIELLDEPTEQVQSPALLGETLTKPENKNGLLNDTNKVTHIIDLIGKVDEIGKRNARLNEVTKSFEKKINILREEYEKALTEEKEHKEN